MECENKQNQQGLACVGMSWNMMECVGICWNGVDCSHREFRILQTPYASTPNTCKAAFFALALDLVLALPLALPLAVAFAAALPFADAAGSETVAGRDANSSWAHV